MALLAASIPFASGSGLIVPQIRPQSPAQYVFVTNRVTRNITNVIEMNVPLNLIAYEFRTNWIEQFHTNMVDVYFTNRFEQNLTNTVVVDLPRTNWIVAYRTNLNTLHATNWQTMVILKTNWITEATTNTLEINLPAGQASTAAPEPATAPANETPSDAHVIASTRGLKIELRRTQKPPQNNQVEVELSVVSTVEPASLRVQEWQLVRPDGTVLLFGQRPQFKAELTPGTYHVLVTARLRDRTAPVTINGTMTLTADGSISQPLVSASTAR
jgi:hypothetical protein